MATTELDDFRWLVGEQAEAYLNRAAEHRQSTVALVQSLRKDLSPSRAHLVASQIELRERARQKFSAAENMLFTRKLLEQATDEGSARYKASRFPPDAALIDLCCGLGGDLLALAARGPCQGIDVDPISALLAHTNCQRLGLARGTAAQGDACTVEFEPGSLWHIDPDRRTGGTRSIRAEYWTPDADALRALMLRHPDGAIKLAPASPLPDAFADQVELEWIGQPRSCRQQIAWVGSLARHPSQHTATILPRRKHDQPVSITGLPDQPIEATRTLGRFVHEPHAAVLASGLTGALATLFGLQAITTGVAYLTSGEQIDDSRLATFEVLAEMPFDLKLVKAALRERKLGHLEIKHRGLQLDPDRLRKQLRVPGEHRACLIVVGGRGKARAILCTRCQND